MVKITNSNTTSKDEKLSKISTIIRHYDGYEKALHKDEDNWYGATFDKLMNYPTIRLNNLYNVVVKKASGAKTGKDGN